MGIIKNNNVQKTRIFVLFLLIIIAGASVLADGITQCTQINSPGTYYLSNDIASVDDCIVISSSNVTLDCGYLGIHGVGNSTGITVMNAGDVVIQGCSITNFSTGVSIENSNNVLIMQSRMSDNKIGLLLNSTSAVSTNNNTISSNSQFNVKNLDVQADATYDYWGSTNNATIASTMSGNVLFNPFLTQDPYGDTDNDGIINALDN